MHNLKELPVIMIYFAALGVFSTEGSNVCTAYFRTCAEYDTVCDVFGILWKRDLIFY